MQQGNLSHINRRFLALAFIALLCCCPVMADTGGGEHKSPAKVLQGSVAHNEVIDTLEQLGIKCALQGSDTGNLLIREVRLGSSAAYAGVEAGDIPRKFVPGDGGFYLTAERNGKIYQVHLALLQTQA